MKQNNLFLDIETTGLPPKNSNWETDYMKFPHIVSISWINTNGQMNDYIIKSDNYLIPKSATKIHGITNKIAMDKGVDLGMVLIILLKDASEANKIIGHNLYFDISIIKANVLKIIKIHKPVLFCNETNETIDAFNINNFNTALHKDKRIDTMFKTIKFVGAKQKNSNRCKMPTLIELHTKLFGEGFKAHNSKDDVIATRRCYDKLIELKII